MRARIWLDPFARASVYFDFNSITLLMTIFRREKQSEDCVMPERTETRVHWCPHPIDACTCLWHSIAGKNNREQASG